MSPKTETAISTNMVHTCLKKKAPGHVSPLAAAALANAMDQVVKLVAEDATKQMEDAGTLQTKHIKKALVNLRCAYPDIICAVDAEDATFKKAGSLLKPGSILGKPKSKKAGKKAAEAAA